MSSRPTPTPEILEKRARLTRAVRAFFDDLDCFEIQVPLMVSSPGLEPHLDAFEVVHSQPNRYLHTSPEYALKKLLGLGLKRVYSLGPCFWNEPISKTHSPQFTMLEWYMTGFDLFELMTQTEALVQTAWRSLGCPNIHIDDIQLDLDSTFERLTVRDAFKRYAGLDPWHFESADDLLKAAQDAGLTSSQLSGRWDDIFFEIFLNHVEPQLGRERPVFLWGWPASQAALSRIDPSDPTRALRFELFAGGLELANAFDELIDSEEQRRRFESDQHMRASMRKTVYPIDEALLDALNNMSPTSGIALGFDRLVMLMLGCSDICEVIVSP